MLKKILRASSFIFLSFFIVSSTIFSGIAPAQAILMSSDNNEDNSMDIVIKESIDSLDGSKTSAVPDLGDDQAFPFHSLFSLSSYLIFCINPPPSATTTGENRNNYYGSNLRA